MMKTKGTKLLCMGAVLLVLFVIWTVLIQTVDVRLAGESGTAIGFATINCRFHQWTDVHLGLYVLTDWFGLVPVLACVFFGTVGLVQWIKRRSLRAVDFDLLVLGVYYVVVILLYLVFEAYPINYRPILIKGVAEASYPSSTTLLVLSVMPTVMFQSKRRIRSGQRIITALTVVFSLFMVLGRIVSGVHWVTDIAGAVLLSLGLYCGYKGIVLQHDKEE